MSLWHTCPTSSALPIGHHPASHTEIFIWFSSSSHRHLCRSCFQFIFVSFAFVLGVYTPYNVQSMCVEGVALRIFLFSLVFLPSDIIQLHIWFLIGSGKHYYYRLHFMLALYLQLVSTQQALPFSHENSVYKWLHIEEQWKSTLCVCAPIQLLLLSDVIAKAAARQTAPSSWRYNIILYYLYCLDLHIVTHYRALVTLHSNTTVNQLTHTLTHTEAQTERKKNIQKRIK